MSLFIPKDLPPLSPSKSVKTAQIINDYEANDADELTVKVGDMVEIIDESTGRDGWLKVRNNKPAISRKL